jgi:hypothetical protein
VIANEPASYFRSEKFIRDWAAHMNATYDDHDVGFVTGDRLASNLRTLHHVERWLDKYSDYMIAALSRPRRRKTKQRKIDPMLAAITAGEAGDACLMRIAGEGAA